LRLCLYLLPDGEQIVENFDDNGDDNDEEGGAGCSRQELFEPVSRCYTFRHQGIDVSVSQHPALNENGQRKEEAAKILDRSDMTNEGDSPDCSSSSYQTNTNLHSTRSRGSDSTLIQNRKVSQQFPSQIADDKIQNIQLHSGKHSINLICS
jgi:hypothetical protein